MATEKFKLGDKAKFVFSKDYFKDAMDGDGNVLYSVGADDKTYTGKVVLVQDNGYCTVEFKKAGEDDIRQASLPVSKLTKV